MLKSTLFSLVTLIIISVNSIHAQIITTIAGTDSSTYCNGCPATSSSLSGAAGLAMDRQGNLYLSSDDMQGNKIRKISPSGIITVFAGTDTSGFSGDGGPATLAKLGRSGGITADTVGNVYFTDRDNSIIRKVDTNGIISTFAGIPGGGCICGDGGPATNATLYLPLDIAADAFGNIYYSELTWSVVRKIDASEIISIYAGVVGTAGYSGDGGAATSALLNSPRGLAVDNIGNLYISYFFNSVIRKVNTAGIISTVAGGGSTDTLEGVPATTAQLLTTYIGCDQSGNLYLGDRCRIRKVDTSGIITTVAGSFATCYTINIGDGGPALNANLGFANKSVFDNASNMYITSNLNRVREVHFATAAVDNTIRANEEVKLYPNPASGEINISSSYHQKHVEIYNFMGELLLQKDSNSETVKLDISRLPSGMYCVRVNEAQVVKFVKE